MPPTDTLLLAHEEALEALLAALRLAKEQGDLRELRLAAKAILSLRQPATPLPPAPAPEPSPPAIRPEPPRSGRRTRPPSPAARAAAAAGLPALSQLLTLTDSPDLMARLLAGEDAESLLGLRPVPAQGGAARNPSDSPRIRAKDRFERTDISEGVSSRSSNPCPSALIRGP